VRGIVVSDLDFLAADLTLHGVAYAPAVQAVVIPQIQGMIGHLALTGILIGIIATVVMDIWAAVAKNFLGLPTASWALVGRWFGHMFKGRFMHKPIANSVEVTNELAIGWIAHYVIGALYGLMYLASVGILKITPSIGSALVFGIVTLAAPWLIMQPCMGAGFFASSAPNRNVVRLVNLSMHTVFGASLYLAWILAR